MRPKITVVYKNHHGTVSVRIPCGKDVSLSLSLCSSPANIMCAGEFEVITPHTVTILTITMVHVRGRDWLDYRRCRTPSTHGLFDLHFS